MFAVVRASVCSLLRVCVCVCYPSSYVNILYATKNAQVICLGFAVRSPIFTSMTFNKVVKQRDFGKANRNYLVNLLAGEVYVNWVVNQIFFCIIIWN